jgi:hypothetical protein
MPAKAKQSRDNDVQASIQATIVKKCSRVAHRPETNKACAAGRCQHTCEPAQAGQCPHKWTVRYSVDSVQHEESFAELDQAQAFQLKLSSGKREEGKMFVDPRAGVVPFLPLAIAFIGNLPRAGERAKEVYRSNMRNPAVVALLQGRSVREVAVMEDEVTELLNVTIGGYQDEYRCTVRRVISDTLDQCVRRGLIPRHMLGGIELGPRVVSAEQYEKEQERRALVYLTDEQVRLLADGTQATRAGRKGPQLLQGLGISAWLMRTMGLRIRESLGVRKSDFKTRPDGTRYLHLRWQASTDGRKLVPLKHRKAGDYRDVPARPTGRREPVKGWPPFASPEGRDEGAPLTGSRRHQRPIIGGRCSGSALLPEPDSRHAFAPARTAPDAEDPGPPRDEPGVFLSCWPVYKLVMNFDHADALNASDPATRFLVSLTRITP